MSAHVQHTHAGHVAVVEYFSWLVWRLLVQAAAPASEVQLPICELAALRSTHVLSTKEYRMDFLADPKHTDNTHQAQVHRDFRVIHMKAEVSVLAHLVIHNKRVMPAMRDNSKHDAIQIEMRGGVNAKYAQRCCHSADNQKGWILGP